MKSLQGDFVRFSFLNILYKGYFTFCLAR